MINTKILIALIIFIGLALEISPVLSDCLSLNRAIGTHIDLKGPDVVQPSTGYNYQWSVLNSAFTPTENGQPSPLTEQHLIFDVPDIAPGTYTINLLISDKLNEGCINNACVTLTIGEPCCPLEPYNFCADKTPTGDDYPAKVCYPDTCIEGGLSWQWSLNGDHLEAYDNTCVNIDWSSNDSPMPGIAGMGENQLLLQLFKTEDGVLKVLENCGPVKIIKIPVPPSTITPL
jgi:hypothetical protein